MPTIRAHLSVPVTTDGKEPETFALISMNVLPMSILAILMESVPMSTLLLNASVKLDMLVMVSLALTLTNVLKQMLATPTPHATILLVLMSAHDTLVTAAMVNPVLIMRTLKW